MLKTVYSQRDRKKLQKYDIHNCSIHRVQVVGVNQEQNARRWKNTLALVFRKHKKKKNTERETERSDTMKYGLTANSTEQRSS
jgi:3-polyprenyl-4-hydroxybenzoate decarboxylase